LALAISLPAFFFLCIYPHIQWGTNLSNILYCCKEQWISTQINFLKS
jgi:hypothetical protein